MGNYYLAVDIGASSGRHILGWMEDGRICTEEIYRFSNGMEKKDGQLCWDLVTLFSEIKAGMKKCKEIGKIPVSMGIDTWAVDFVLLDEKDEILGNTVGYRDKRTEHMDERVYAVISKEELYRRTGIQKLNFNTIFQLMAVKESHPDYLKKAKCFLMIPDYFHYLLTGIKACEYTNATTTQLVGAVEKQWDYELLDMLGYPQDIFPEIKEAGAPLGMLLSQVAEEVGFQTRIVLPATHDTGSAVAAVPSNDDSSIYISSGTWSLMGIESPEPECSVKSMEANFTNEGGYEYRFRYLKNIMGLWMIQSVKKEFAEKLSFSEICELASRAEITSIVDCNDDCFLAPESMIEAVQEFCRKSRQQVPETTADIAAVIYNSLAKCYKETVREIEDLTEKTYDKIHVVGGGSNAEYLNILTARECEKEVHAGPGEATAIGNLLVQMLTAEEFSSLKEARQCVHDSFSIKIVTV